MEGKRPWLPLAAVFGVNILVIRLFQVWMG
jgi:hypothetical protein